MYCLCPPGVVNCERLPDPQTCGEGHCLNGGVCLTNTLYSGETVSQCDCSLTQKDNTIFAGRFCQYQSTSFCSDTGSFDKNLFCVNNGECNKADPYRGCACPENYRGFHCQFYVAEGMDNANTPKSSDTHTPEISDAPANPVSDPLEQTVCDLDCGDHGVCNIGVKDNSNLGEAAFAPHLGESHTEDYRHCICAEGWVGVKCDQEITTCDGTGVSFCLHGARCTKAGPDQPNTCDCTTATSKLGDSFVGDHCQHFSTDICSIAQDGPAKPVAFCTNGGACKKRGIPLDAP
jgi:hypothetical protein